MTAAPNLTLHPGRRPGADRIRLLIVSSTLHVGGAEQVASLLARYVDRRMFEVTACYLKENGVVGHAMQAAGVDLIPISPRASGGVDYFTSLKLLREVKRRDIQVIHSHDVHGLLDSSVCRLLAPGLRHAHTFHFGNYPREFSTSRGIEQLAWRVPDSLIAVGHTQAAAIANTYRIDPARLNVVWNGVETPRSSIAAEVADATAQPTRPVLMSISTLTEQKGLPILLQACTRLRQSGRDFLLLIIGDGPLRKQLENQVAALGLCGNIRLLGWIPEASRRALPACDIFVQSSLWEAMSVVVLEAMATARPMVLTRVGDNDRAICHGESGLLVPPGDATGLADALLRLLDDSSLAQRLGAAARARYQAQFTVDQMISRYQDLYLEMTRRP